jgi:hypothetical protein
MVAAALLYVSVSVSGSVFASASADNMGDWDQEKLEQVVKTKHGAQVTNRTDIVRQCRWPLPRAIRSDVCCAGRDCCTR